MNELKEMADRLNGYDKNDWYEITSAKKDGDEWTLTVRHITKQNDEGAENESN